MIDALDKRRIHCQLCHVETKSTCPIWAGNSVLYQNSRERNDREFDFY